LGSTTILFTLILSSCDFAYANVCVYKTLHILRVRGHVTDDLGENIPGAKLTVKNDGKTVLESAANQQGIFSLKVPRGMYELRVDAPGFAPGFAYFQTGFGMRSVFNSKTIVMKLHVGAICKNNRQMKNQEDRRLQS
jgi:hypothetical protein